MGQMEERGCADVSRRHGATLRLWSAEDKGSARVTLTPMATPMHSYQVNALRDHQTMIRRPQ